jgi:hypothetical protein
LSGVGRVEVGRGGAEPEEKKRHGGDGGHARGQWLKPTLLARDCYRGERR